MDIKTFKERFDPVLAKVLTAHLQQTAAITTDAFVRELVEYTEKLLLSGGKRVRPYLAYLGYQSARRKTQDARSERLLLETIAGLELFHAFALVHDDIMDRGTARHGLATAHVQAAHRMRELGRYGDIPRLAEGQAILLGDLLFNWASERLAGTKAFPIFFKMINEVIIGQMLDVDSMSRHLVDDAMIAERLRLKTATYTFVRPMQVGAALAGSHAKFMKFAEAFGVPLGIGFQIQDDLLDLITPADVHGKTSFSDLHDGQHTVFTQYIFRHGTPEQVRELRSLFGAHLTENDRHHVIKLFESSGSLEYGASAIEEHFKKAEEAVQQSGLTGAKAKPFMDLVAYIRQRTH